jgi:hypothetical protein
MESAFKIALLSERMSYTSKEELSKAGFYFQNKFDNIVCMECGWVSRSTLTLAHINFMHKIIKPDCLQAKKIQGDYDCYAVAKNCALQTEKAMTDSFDSWPKLLPNIKKLVSAGFYYTGYKDDVACVSCGVTLCDWDDTDDPWAEHKSASPSCSLVESRQRYDEECCRTSI